MTDWGKLSEAVKPIHIVPPDGVEIRAGDRGRGVFATRDFKEGDVIERCPMLKVRYDGISGSTLGDYVFDGGDGSSLIVLGYGMLYNHSEEPNTDYRQEEDDFVFFALKDIEAGEELTITYGESWWSSRERSPV